QAEDGIRDFHVTGVQTCALPIYFLAAAFFAVVFLAAGLSSEAFFFGVALASPSAFLGAAFLAGAFSALSLAGSASALAFFLAAVFFFGAGAGAVSSASMAASSSSRVTCRSVISALPNRQSTTASS